MAHQCVTDCTATCHSSQHGSQITAAIIRGTEQEAIAYMQSLCSGCCFVKDDSGKTALHTAASCGKKKVVHWLLNRGACVNQQDKESGYGPLHRALFYGHIHVALTLLKANGNLHLRDNEGLTPLNHVILDRPFVPATADHPLHAYVWGSNNNYNLGQASQQARDSPELLETVQGDAKQISMNKFHTLFVTLQGNVFACGLGHGGRLGLGSDVPVILPQEVKGLQHVEVVMAATGVNHSIFLAQTGQVFTCGTNEYSQLGHSPPPDFLKHPRTLPWHKSHRDEFAVGVGAACYHSVFWTDKSVYTFGLNAGQLGHFKNSNERCIIVPRKVTAVVLKDSSKIISVAVSDGSIVVLTSTGDIFILHQYHTRRITTSKLADVRKIACVGGHLDTMVGAEGIRERGNMDLKIAIITVDGFLYLWTEHSNHLTRCIFNLRQEILVSDFCFNQICIGIVTKNGEVYLGTHLQRKTSTAGEKSERCGKSGTSTLVQLPDHNFCESFRLQRIPLLHRSLEITSDPKGKNFAVFQYAPKTFLKSGPSIRESAMRRDLGALLEEACESDAIHDVILIAGNQRFPAHSFILACQSDFLCQKLLSKKFMKCGNGNSSGLDVTLSSGAKSITINGIEPDILKEVLTYMYKSTCPTMSKISKLKIAAVNSYGENYSPTSQSFKNTIETDGEPLNKHCSRRRRGKKNEVKHASVNSLSKLDKAAVKLGIKLLHEEIGKYQQVSPGCLEESDLEGKNSFRIRRDLHPELWDVMITSQNGEAVGAHRAILAARLEYFHAMLGSGWLESSSGTLSMPLPSDILDIVLQYLYEDDSTTLRESSDLDFVGSVLVVADQLLIVRLKEICESVMFQHVTLRNAVRLLDFSASYNAEQLKYHIMQFICQNMATYLENGMLHSLSGEVQDDLSRHYRKFVSRMAYRCMTPHDAAPTAEDLEAALKKNPVNLPDSDEELGVGEFGKDPARHGSGNSSGKIRKRRWSQKSNYAESRTRRSSTSSQVSSSSLSEGEMSKEFEALTFDDLEDKVPSCNSPENIQTSPGSSELKEENPWKTVRKNKVVIDCDGSRNKFSSVGFKDKTPEGESRDRTPVKPVVRSSGVLRCSSKKEASMSSEQAEDLSQKESSFTALDKHCALPAYPTLADAVAASLSKSPSATKFIKGKKISKKQKRLLVSQASTEKEDTKDIKPTPTAFAWDAGIADSNASNSTFQEAGGLACALAISQTHLEGSELLVPLKNVPGKNGLPTSRPNFLDTEQTSERSYAARSGHAQKLNGTVCENAWSCVASSPPKVVELSSPEAVTIKTAHPQPSAAASRAQEADVFETPCFSKILEEEKIHSMNLLREQCKPLSLIQLEDQAMEDLLAHYKRISYKGEKVTVVRVKSAVADPTWRK